MSNIELITNQLGTHLFKQIESASSICILTSFTMQSGVSYLANYLKKAAERGADIKIGTGDYLYITQPDVLAALLDIHEKSEIRIWKSNATSFIPRHIYFKMNHMIVLLSVLSNFQNLPSVTVSSEICRSAMNLTNMTNIMRHLNSFCIFLGERACGLIPKGRQRQEILCCKLVPIFYRCRLV